MARRAWRSFSKSKDSPLLQTDPHILLPKEENQTHQWCIKIARSRIRAKARTSKWWMETCTSRKQVHHSCRKELCNVRVRTSWHCLGLCQNQNVRRRSGKGPVWNLDWPRSIDPNPGEANLTRSPKQETSEIEDETEPPNFHHKMGQGWA